MSRPRKDGPRYPGGKLKPQTDSGDTVALRNRVVSMMGKARSLGTVQAVLWAHKKLTSDQFDAADWYQEQHAAYQKALQSPGAPREGINGGNGNTLTPEEAAERVSGLVRRFEALQAKLDGDQKKALECITVQVFDFRELPALLTALDAIHSYRMHGNRKRA